MFRIPADQAMEDRIVRQINSSTSVTRQRASVRALDDWLLTALCPRTRSPTRVDIPFDFQSVLDDTLLAALLKRYFRMLPEPLISATAFTSLSDAAGMWQRWASLALFANKSRQWPRRWASGVLGCDLMERGWWSCRWCSDFDRGTGAGSESPAPVPPAGAGVSVSVPARGLRQRCGEQNERLQPGPLLGPLSHSVRGHSSPIFVWTGW